MGRLYKTICFMALLVGVVANNPAFGEWSGPINVFTAKKAKHPVVGVDASGNAMILAILSDDNREFHIEGKQFAQGSLQNAQRFSSLKQEVIALAVSVNALGNAVAIWAEADIDKTHHSDKYFFRSSLFMNNVWEDPSVVSTHKSFADYSYAPYVFLDSSNKAITVWLGSKYLHNGFLGRIQWNQFSSAWLGQHNLFTASDRIYDLALTSTSLGKSLAVWYNVSDFNQTGFVTKLQAAYYDGDRWSISDVATEAYNTIGRQPTVAINPSNQAIILWEDTETHGIKSASFFEGNIGEHQLVYTPSEEEIADWDAKVAIDGAGRAIALWTTNPILKQESTLMASRYSEGIWGAPVILDTTNGDNYLSHPNISMDDQGNAYVVWEKKLNNANDSSIYATRYTQADDSWDDAKLLSSPGAYAFQSKLSMNDSEMALVVWCVKENDQEVIQAVYTK